MNGRFSWGSNDIVFLDEKQLSQDKVYASAINPDQPYAACTMNSGCNGKCSKEKEASAYALACKIYDSISDELNLEKDTKKQIFLLKRKTADLLKEPFDESCVTCVKIQLLMEFKVQTKKSLSEEEVRAFILAEEGTTDK